MFNIYIPKIDFNTYKLKELSPLIRPFVNENGLFENNDNAKERWGVELTTNLTSDFQTAQVALFPYPLESMAVNIPEKDLFFELKDKCVTQGITLICYVAGDFGALYPSYKNVVYFRNGGFNSGLDKNNHIFPFLLADHLKGILNKDEIEVRNKSEKLVIGFCGHASRGLVKRFYENLKFMKINLLRLRKGDFSFEPIFPSAFKRASILQHLEKDSRITCNFIYRENYRGGSRTPEEKAKTTLEYYENMFHSDYILCLRGAGNFSVRFFETLMLGRVPILIDTDVKLVDLEMGDNWNNHIFKVDISRVQELSKLVLEFHSELDNETFRTMQKNNRDLFARMMKLDQYYKVSFEHV